MSFRQYTKCYVHTTGDKPFNKDDLVSYALGASTPGLVAAIAAFLLGAYAIGFVIVAVQYAVTITAIANEWLYHRLVCISGNQCAVGTVNMPPNRDTLLGAFDNDQFFDIRLMPHRYEDAYRAPNAPNPAAKPPILGGYFPAIVNPGDNPGSEPWTINTATSTGLPSAGPSLDGLTENFPMNDIYLDNFQGSALLQAGSASNAIRAGSVNMDLPYQAIDWTQDADAALADAKSSELPRAALVTRAALHCEAEGNFWVAMKESAGWQGLAVGAGAAAGAAAGAGAGCAIGGVFGFIGCAIGAVIGFILGLGAGGAAAAYIAANAAFNTTPGDVNDANVGDVPIGNLSDGEQVIVYGTHVYDGFHTGWHEFHPLMAVMRAPGPEIYQNIPSLAVEQITFVPPYIEWNPNWVAGVDGPLTSGLTDKDMQMGLESPSFTRVAKMVKDTWCSLLGDRFAPGTITSQLQTQNRWAVHPLVDGCEATAATTPR
jgi:hypothetical protein